MTFLFSVTRLYICTLKYRTLAMYTFYISSNIDKAYYILVELDCWIALKL